MKTLILSSFFIIQLLSLYSQNSSKFDLSSSIGLGLIESDKGYAIDGELSTQVLPKLRAGLYYNLMSSQLENLPVSDVYFLTIDEFYLKNTSNFYTRNTQKFQHSFGLHMKYAILDRRKFQINLGAGINYNVYKSTSFIMNGQTGTSNFASYMKWNQFGVSYHIGNDIYYKIHDKLHLGLKTRLMEFKDYNFSFMFSTLVKL